jgi:hypothetical protein
MVTMSRWLIVVSPDFARLFLQMHTTTVITIAIMVMGMHIPSTIAITLFDDLML